VNVVGKTKEKFSVVLEKEGICVNTLMGATLESLAPITTIAAQTLPVDSKHPGVELTWFVDPDVFYMRLAG
jgi:hypothetical protein